MVGEHPRDQPWAQAVVDPAVEAGGRLRAARTARGWTVVDVARRLHFATTQVRDLESGAMGSFYNLDARRRLGGLYCDLLELPRELAAIAPRPLAPRLAEAGRSRPEAAPRGSARQQGRSRTGAYRRRALLLALLSVVLVPFALEAWQRWGGAARSGIDAALGEARVTSSAPASRAADAGRPKPPLPGVTASPVPSAAPSESAPASVAALAAPAASASSAASAASAAPTGMATEAAAAPRPGQAGAPGRLRIEVVGGRCWVDVRHDQGRFARTLEPGEQLDLPAAGVRRVMLGNAPAVRATLDGRPLALRSTGGITAVYEQAAARSAERVVGAR